MDCIPYINDLLIEIDTLEKFDSSNDEIKEKIIKKKKTLNEIKSNLSKMSKNSIEYRLYLKILSGKTSTQAVKEIADENYANDIKPYTERAIYKNYYKNIKNLIKVQ